MWMAVSQCDYTGKSFFSRLCLSVISFSSFFIFDLFFCFKFLLTFFRVALLVLVVDFSLFFCDKLNSEISEVKHGTNKKILFDVKFIIIIIIIIIIILVLLLLFDITI